MKYAYIDGDNVGLIIEKCFLENDEKGLNYINSYIIDTIKKIEQYLLQSKLDIIFSGADGIICKGEVLDHIDLLKFIREISKDVTFSIGIGSTLKESYVALRYAKSNYKNNSVEFKDNNFTLYK